MVIDDFGQFWNAYPRKSSIVQTRVEWAEAVKLAQPQVIIDAAIAFANDPNRDPSYTPSSFRWLAERRWMDSPLPPRKLTPDEAKKAELDESRRKSEEERQKTLQARLDDEAMRAKAVPMPDYVKEQLKGLWRHGE